jgi:hypothetical protein
MIRNVSRKFALALTLLILTVPSSRVKAQSTTPPANNPNPSVVTGTDPEPQDDIIETILSLLFFA